MKFFVGVKKTDYEILRSDLTEDIEFVVWPNKPNDPKNFFLKDIGEAVSGDKCYIHFSGYSRLSGDDLRVFNSQCINIHPAPPCYPGVGGINWALYKNETEFAVTVHIMNEKIDSGQILDVFWFKLQDSFGIEQANQLLFEIRRDCLQRLITNLNEVSFTDFISAKTPNVERWGNKIFWRHELDSMQELILDEISEISELKKRIRAFHTVQFPLKIKFGKRVFSLKDASVW